MLRLKLHGMHTLFLKMQCMAEFWIDEECFVDRDRSGFELAVCVRGHKALQV